ATATIISAINAMTMAPARAVTLIKPHREGEHREPLPRAGVAIAVGVLAVMLLAGWLARLLGLSHGGAETLAPRGTWLMRGGLFTVGAAGGWLFAPAINRGLQAFFDGFNRVFERVTNVYGRAVASLVRMSAIAVACYVGMLGLTYVGFTHVPLGFLPQQDKGY